MKMSEDEICKSKKNTHLSSDNVIKLSDTNRQGFLPPVLQEVSKLAAGVAAVATGSSTGNHRNKHALQPGHSLMDWIRLGSSGKDLTGVGLQSGKLSITLDELALHNKSTDGWIAIKGKVYNISHYLSFHPGGIDELMRGAGKDATKLFDQVHAWVNYESLLQKCYVGKLTSINSEINPKNLLLGIDNLISSKVHQNIKLQHTPSNTTPINTIQEQDDKLSKKYFPRFDWIQKTDCISLIFNMDPISNPRVEVSAPNVPNWLTIYLKTDFEVFFNQIILHKKIQWPCQIKLNYESGKIEIVLKKFKSEVWADFGVLTQKTEEVSAVITKIKHNYTIVNKVHVNYNTTLFELRRNDETKFTVPIGKHVKVFINIQGHDLSRSYTPVPSSIFIKFKPQVFATDTLCLLIKSYPNGTLSKHICSKKDGDVLEISEPLGTFNLLMLDNRETFILIAGGTGITPMLAIILFLLERRIRRCNNITLVFFNKKEEDILLKDQLENLQKEDNRFKLYHVLSEPTSQWLGFKGHISRNLLDIIVEEHVLNTVYKKSDVFTLICGPTEFCSLTETLLLEIGFSTNQTYLLT